MLSRIEFSGKKSQFTVNCDVNYLHQNDRHYDRHYDRHFWSEIKHDLKIILRASNAVDTDHSTQQANENVVTMTNLDKSANATKPCIDYY